MFPPGQGRAPVLGTRWSDALAFCSWLTKRGARAWCYRLPQIGELERDAIESIPSEETGYWADENGLPRIVWLRGPPQAINVQINRAYALALASTSALALYITLFLLRERIGGWLPAYEGILLVRERRDKEETTRLSAPPLS